MLPRGGFLCDDMGLGKTIQVNPSEKLNPGKLQTRKQGRHLYSLFIVDSINHHKSEATRFCGGCRGGGSLQR